MTTEEFIKLKENTLFNFKEILEELASTSFSLIENMEICDNEDEIEYYESELKEIFDQLDLYKDQALNVNELLNDNEDYIYQLFTIWPHDLVDYNIFHTVASTRLQNSIDFIYKLLITDVSKDLGWNWKDFPIAFWDNKICVLAALNIDQIILKYVSEDLKKDEDIINATHSDDWLRDCFK
jgi:hypothetical protein